MPLCICIMQFCSSFRLSFSNSYMYCFKVSVQSCLFPNLLVLIYADLAFQYNHTYSPSCSNSYMYWFRISVSHVSNSSWFIYVLVQDITVVMPISHCFWSIHVLGQVFTVKLPSLPFTLIPISVDLLFHHYRGHISIHVDYSNISIFVQLFCDFPMVYWFISMLMISSLPWPCILHVDLY